jgi:hypothetical protein
LCALCVLAWEGLVAKLNGLWIRTKLRAEPDNGLRSLDEIGLYRSNIPSEFQPFEQETAGVCSLWVVRHLSILPVGRILMLVIREQEQMEALPDFVPHTAERALVGKGGMGEVWKARDSRSIAFFAANRLQRVEAGFRSRCVMPLRCVASKRVQNLPRLPGGFLDRWRPLQRRVIHKLHDQARAFFRKNVDGLEDEQPVYQSLITGYPADWSRDSHFILYQSLSVSETIVLFVLPVMSDGRIAPGTQSMRVVLRSDGRNGRFSPEQSPRWIAFHSKESGKNEVYIQRFPEPHGRIQVSQGGGVYAQWGAGGKELLNTVGAVYDRAVWDIG